MKTNVIAAFVCMIIYLTVAGMFFPWWILPGGILLIAALFISQIKHGLLAGSASYFMVFTGTALYMLSFDEAEIINKTGILMGGMTAPILLLINSMIAIITGGLAGWFGVVIGNFIRGNFNSVEYLITTKNKRNDTL